MTQGDRKLTVLTYNIHSCVGSDGKYSVERIAEVVKGVDADVVCLQEVEVNATQQVTRVWSEIHGDDQPALIAGIAGYPHVKFARAIYCKADKSANSEFFTESGEGQFGIALLSKWPIQDVETLEYSPYFSKTPRNALACSINTPSCGSIWVVCTHLGCHYRGGEQLQQALELIEFVQHLQSKTSQPLVLAGDFNCPPWFRAVKELKKALADAHTSNAGTFPSTGIFKGGMKLDYILYSRSNLACISTTAHVDGVIASDHRPFSACLQVQSNVDSNSELDPTASIDSSNEVP